MAKKILSREECDGKLMNASSCVEIVDAFGEKVCHYVRSFHLLPLLRYVL